MVAIYGEGDARLASRLQSQKSLMRLGNKDAVMSAGYAGNLAWAHIVANQALQTDAALGGEAYFITDDTPDMNRWDLVEKLTATRGSNIVSTRNIPYWILYIMTALIMLISYAVSPFYEINVDFSLDTILFLRHSYTFRRTKAEKRLGYKPLYDFQQSIVNSRQYYKNA